MSLGEPHLQVPIRSLLLPRGAISARPSTSWRLAELFSPFVAIRFLHSRRRMAAKSTRNAGLQVEQPLSANAGLHAYAPWGGLGKDTGKAALASACRKPACTSRSPANRVCPLPVSRGLSVRATGARPRRPKTCSTAPVAKPTIVSCSSTVGGGVDGAAWPAGTPAGGRPE